MKNNFNTIIEKLGNKRVLRNEPLSRHTYMKVGGPADLFFVAHNADDIMLATQYAIEQHIPYFILGGGSNILVGDKGIRGLVIKNRADTIKIIKRKGKIKENRVDLKTAHVVVESGVITNLLVRRTIDESLAGLEYFLGVPGTIGGAIYNNSHFKTELIGNYVECVEVIGHTGKRKVYSKSQMKFQYDSSVLQKTHEAILSVTFLLKGGDKKILWKKAEEYARYRSDSQPLNFPSSGCMFKNVDTYKGKYGQDRDGLTSAGYLIDKAGLKGTRVGKAEVSQKHASFIINRGGATAREVANLIELVQAKVKDKHGVQLEMEVFKVGEF